MIIEIQEPTDYTIRIEKTTPSGFEIDDAMCHQGLGFEKMFECFDYEGNTEESILKKYRIAPKKMEGSNGVYHELVGYKDTPCFGIEKFEIEKETNFTGEEVFYCMYVLSGQGILKTGEEEFELKQNGQFFVPADCGDYSVINTGETALEILKMHGPE
ncbi:MAG: hypothetical protein KH828_14110 [Clostridiales bacterium]|nr:hypothetical protein [Clostridiales bacterium]